VACHSHVSDRSVNHHCFFSDPLSDSLGDGSSTWFCVLAPTRTAICPGLTPLNRLKKCRLRECPGIREEIRISRQVKESLSPFTRLSFVKDIWILVTAATVPSADLHMVVKIYAPWHVINATRPSAARTFRRTARVPMACAADSSTSTPLPTLSWPPILPPRPCSAIWRRRPSGLL